MRTGSPTLTAVSSVRIRLGSVAVTVFSRRPSISFTQLQQPTNLHRTLLLLLLSLITFTQLFSTHEQTHCALIPCDSDWVTRAFYGAFFFYIQWSGRLTALFLRYMAGATWNCCRLSTPYVYTIHVCTSLQCHFMQSHIWRVQMCLAVSGHLYFCQNDWDLLCATAVTRGWGGYWNMSQHWKLTLEKKIILPLLPGLEPTTFQSSNRSSTTELN